VDQRSVAGGATNDRQQSGVRKTILEGRGSLRWQVVVDDQERSEGIHTCAPERRRARCPFDSGGSVTVRKVHAGGVAAADDHRVVQSANVRREPIEAAGINWWMVWGG
jgi:hypothetical protein